MTTFDDREKAFENKFAHDEELRFKAAARRNKLLGAWAAGKLGMKGAAVDEYVKAASKANLIGTDDIFRKIRQDFDDKGVQIDDDALRQTMGEFLVEAVSQIERGA